MTREDQLAQKLNKVLKVAKELKKNYKKQSNYKTFREYLISEGFTLDEAIFTESIAE